MKIKIEGMSCAHCKARVESAIKALPGVKSAQADFKTGEVLIEGQANLDSVRACVEDAGFDFVSVV